MDQRAVDLQARLATVASFRDLVNAMRGVAAARAQQARTRLAGVNAFARTVADAMAQALTLLPPPAGVAPGGRRLLIVCCAEQGFNGGLSARVLDAVPDLAGAPVMLLGTQGLRLARARGVAPVWTAALMSHASAAVTAAERLHAALVETLADLSAGSVDIVAPEVAGNRVTVRRRSLLPLDLAALRSPAVRREQAPGIHLDAATLVNALATEYIAAQLTQTLLHAHAAENLARLQAMAAAHENVERMIDTLHADERQLRQAAITEEIIELAAGLRALRAGADRPPR